MNKRILIGTLTALATAMLAACADVTSPTPTTPSGAARAGKAATSGRAARDSALPPAPIDSPPLAPDTTTTGEGGGRNGYGVGVGM